MSQFTENIHIAPLPQKNKWITTKPLIWHISQYGQEEYIEVPAGFEFDGASVPKIFGMLIQKVEPKTINAACLHDRLYTEGRDRCRMEVEDIFLQSLRACGVKKRKAVAMFMGVYFFGWLVWNKIVKI